MSQAGSLSSGSSSSEVTSVSGTTNRITAIPTTGNVIVNISASYVGQTSITTLGTVTTGTWQGSLITGQYGGTGVDNAGLTINLGSATVDYVLTSDSSGNATWKPASSSGSITTIDGDTGSATPTSGVIKIYSDLAGGNAGASVSFSASGATITYNNTDSNSNVFIGSDAGNYNGGASLGSSVNYNVGIGHSALSAVGTVSGYTGSSNTCIGTQSAEQITNGSHNSFLGYGSGAALTTGSYNCLLGYNAGSNYTTGSESGNININSGGSSSESHVLRIGSATGTGSQQLSAAYICGITGATPTSINSPQVVVCDNTNNLAVIPDTTAGHILTSNSPNSPTFQAAPASSVTFTGDTGTPFSGNAVTVTGASTGLAFAASTPHLTLGGTLVLASGGTNASLTASNGGIFYSTAGAGAILAGTATAGQLLLSGASTAPAWSTTTYPNTNAVNTLLYASSANVMAALATANDGVLITSNSGVPSWLANGTTGQVLTATTGGTPSWSSTPGTVFTSINIQVFSYTGSTQTYTPTSGMLYCIVEVFGGGGGGAGCTTTISAGGGGGSGGYARSVLSAATVGASQTVTIGAAGAMGGTASNGSPGGTTSFGVLVVATGGYGGLYAAGVTSVAGSYGGTPGGASAGEFLVNGNSGGNVLLVTGAALGGDGAAGFFGGGVNGASCSGSNLSSAGQNANSYGAGGGGAAASGAASTALAGGNGSAGVCIVMEFIG